MKKLYSTIMMFAMMFAALSFTACSSSSDDGDEGNSVNPSSLVGTWQTTFVEGWGEYVDVNAVDYLQLKSNGSYIHVEWENNAPYISKGTWSFSNNKLTLKEQEGDLVGSSFTYDVIEIGKDKISVTLWGVSATLKRVSDNVIDKYLKTK